MSRPRGVRRLFRIRSGRRWPEDEVELEFRHHLEMKVDELVEEGWPPDEARRMAESAFGDVAAHRAACVHERRREARMTRMRDVVGNLAGDLRYALRGLRKQPGFAAAVVATLGVGIGANTAIFTVVDHLMIRDLPFERPDELYAVHASYASGMRAPELPNEVTRAFADAPPELGAVLRSARLSAVRDDGAEPATVMVEALEPGFVDLLGVPPELGRPFHEGDAVPGSPDVAMLGYGYWVTAFGADPDVLGRTVILDSIPVSIVGVAGRTFRYPAYGTTEFYVPLADDGTALGRMQTRQGLLTRVPEDAVARVEGALTSFVDAVRERTASTGEWEPVLTAMNEPRVNPDVRQALLVTLGAVTLMLLVAMVNGVNLMLVRGTARTREIGVRLALGGSRMRVVGQMVVESVVLALISGAVATALALIGVDLLWAMAPDELTFFGGQDVAVDGRILPFVGLVATASGLLFGLAPAVRAVAAGASSNRALAAPSGQDPRRRRVRNLLVVGQVAATLALLFGAGLLGRSFTRLVSQDPGMDPEGLVTMNIELSPGRYPDAEMRRAFLHDVRDRVAAIPGITQVTVGGYGLPGAGITFGDGLYLEGQEAPAVDDFVVMPFAAADPGFRRTLGTRLLAGRDLTPADRPADRTVLVTETLTRKLGFDRPGAALGARFTLGDDGGASEIVGVLEDVRLEGLDERFDRAAMIRPFDLEEPGGNLGFLVRTGGDFGAVRDAMKAAVHAVDPGQPIGGFLTVEQSLRDSVQKPRFFMTIMGVFATMALFLAAVGLYGVLAFSVSQRAREMGIRVAVGAERSDVRGLVLREGLGLAVVGMLLGAAVALGASRVMESLLFETSATDVGVLSATAVVLLATAAAASYLPARRATRVDPVEVLKAE